MKPLPTWAYWLHGLIIANLAIQGLYGAYMVFVVFSPGSPGPLGLAALEIDQTLMVNRRLYAQETWIALGSLSVYLGLTEILPRRLGWRSESDPTEPP
ncbi:MAG: hypothetical protein CMH55_10090 [Myxococcales bacterium]|nr:hypothetical protein [Myxococcales bacterium]